MAKRIEPNYRLYAGKAILLFETFEAAKSFMPANVNLTIEILMDIAPNEADFWAYEYQAQRWVAS